MGRSLPPARDLARAVLWRRAVQILTALLALPLVWTAIRDLVLLGRMFWGQYRFPADLEWMEGGQLLHAYRLLHGQALYGDCSDGFIPFPYPPVHAAVLAAVGAVFGLDFRVGRIVSIAAFGVCCWLVGRELIRSSSRPARGALLALVAMASMAASYPVAGRWYDLVRVDSVFMALLLGGTVASLPKRYSDSHSPIRWPQTLLSATLLTAAAYTKQTAVVFLPWICLYAFVRHRRSGWRLALTTAGLFGTTLGLLQWSSDGRFWIYVFDVMSHHGVSPVRSFWTMVRLWLFARFLPVLPLLALWLWHRRRLRSRTVLWLGMLGCALFVSIVTRAKLTAHLNNLMTAALLSWPVAIMLLSDLLESMPRRSWLRFGVIAGLLWWATPRLYHLGFNPEGYLPSAEHWRAARAFNRYVASLPGSVLVPSHSFVPIRQGRSPEQIHKQGWVDAMESGLPDFDFARCLTGIRADWLILDLPSHSYFDAIITTDYEPAGPLPDAIRNVPGLARPDRLYRRKQDAPSSIVRLQPRMLFDFESDGLAGWLQEGEAFRAGTSAAWRPGQWLAIGYRGRGLLNSFDPDLGEQARGSLRSPEFTIDRSHLGFRAGGGRSPKLRIELQIEGHAARTMAGTGSNVDMLVPVVWDVSDLEGQRARLVVEDDETGDWGHLLLDEIELFDVPDSGQVPP